MKLTSLKNYSFRQFITRKAQSYTPLQRVLVTLAGVLIAGFLVTAFAVVVIVASGALVSDPSTVAERSMINAQKAYRETRAEARQKGVAAEGYGPAVQALARIILVQVRQPDLQANARKSADKLIETGTLDPLALYACARAYQTDSKRHDEARLLLSKASHMVGENAGSLSRTIYAAYGRALVKAGENKQAIEYVRKAAEVVPASPGLHVELGRIYENQAEWFDAAVSYAQALKFDPQNKRAKAAFEDLKARQPERAEAALKEVK